MLDNKPFIWYLVNVMENESYIPRRKQVLFNLIQGDGIYHSDEQEVSVIEDGEFIIYSDGTHQSIGATFKHLGILDTETYLKNRGSKINQIISMETLEEI